jgi:hypothetical protein
MKETKVKICAAHEYNNICVLLRNHYIYFVLRIRTNKNVSTHLSCSGMTLKGQTVQGERVLLKQGL